MTKEAVLGLLSFNSTRRFLIELNSRRQCSALGNHKLIKSNMVISFLMTVKTLCLFYCLMDLDYLVESTR
jgi:hypothetical protein